MTKYGSILEYSLKLIIETDSEIPVGLRLEGGKIRVGSGSFKLRIA